MHIIILIVGKFSPVASTEKGQVSLAFGSAQLTDLQIFKHTDKTPLDYDSDIQTIPETDLEEYDADNEQDIDDSTQLYSVPSQHVDSDETYFDSDETHLETYFEQYKLPHLTDSYASPHVCLFPSPPHVDSDETYFDSDETYFDSDETHLETHFEHHITDSDDTPPLCSSPSPQHVRHKTMYIKRSTNDYTYEHY